jgi:hypothetical protein
VLQPLAYIVKMGMQGAGAPGTQLGCMRPIGEHPLSWFFVCRHRPRVPLARLESGRGPLGLGLLVPMIRARREPHGA